MTGIPSPWRVAASAEPGEGAFDHPTSRQEDKAIRLIRALHDLDVDVRDDFLDGVSKLRPLITAIGVELRQEWEGAKQGRHHQRAAVAVLNIRGVHEGVHQQALCIDEDVPLLALDFLACVIARRIAASR